MVRIKLNSYTIHDIPVVLALQNRGVPDEIIQNYCDAARKRMKTPVAAKWAEKLRI